MSSSGSGVQIDSIPCPKCREVGGDLEGDNLRVFKQEDDTINGFCFACRGGEGRFFSDPYNGEEPPEREEEPKKDYKLTLASIGKLPYRAIEAKGITEETCKVYGVVSAVSESDGSTVTQVYYPDTKKGEVVGYEAKKLNPKKFHGIGDRKGAVELWGSKVARGSSGKKLYITEGRDDALALFQCLKENAGSKWSHLTPAVVSLTRGAGGAVKDLLNNRDLVESFPEVVLVFDNDKPGRDAAHAVLKTFPDFKVAEIPQLEYTDKATGEIKITKDANDMYLAGKSIDLRNLVVFKAGVIRQGQVLDVSDFIEDALKKPKRGLDFPWRAVTAATYGLRPHNIHIVGAAPY